jgi:hypothetical protein
VLGALFKSKNFQKNETELMFIVTAQLVKPVNRDDLPQMRGIDGLKNGSPLGVEPKGEGIQGQTGFSITGQSVESQPAAAPQPAAEPKATEQKSEPKTETGTEAPAVPPTKAARLNMPLPVGRSNLAMNFEIVRPQ